MGYPGRGYSGYARYWRLIIQISNDERMNQHFEVIESHAKVIHTIMCFFIKKLMIMSVDRFSGIFQKIPLEFWS